MLMNGILNFALERGAERVHMPTAELALRHTDRSRSPQREMFERIYDRNVTELFPARRRKEWWTIELDSVRARVVVPERGHEQLPRERTICVCHDIERGFGHTVADPAYAAHAHETGPASLAAMLAIEDELQCKATYNVLGLLFEEVREEIERRGHCLAFHSYDHEIDERPVADRLYRLLDRWRGGTAAAGVDGESRQLNKCRELDYRVKGYRPPRSRLTRELSDANLCFHNFEWLANSPRSLGGPTPRLANRLVKIPILCDDFELYRGVPYDEWEQRVIRTLGEHEFGCVCLHDCYAGFWLPRYKELLGRIQELGRLRTMDQVAAGVTFANSA
jgi:hypothetical protein